MSNMSDASTNVPDIGTGRTKRVALPSSRATASKETAAAAAAAAAPERSKARTKPQQRKTQPAAKRSKAPPKASLSKAVVDNSPIPEASGSEEEEQESEENDESLGSVGRRFTKADKEALQKLLALKKQDDANQLSQARAGNVSFFLLIQTLSILHILSRC